MRHRSDRGFHTNAVQAFRFDCGDGTTKTRTGTHPAASVAGRRFRAPAGTVVVFWGAPPPGLLGPAFLCPSRVCSSCRGRLRRRPADSGRRIQPCHQSTSGCCVPRSRDVTRPFDDLKFASRRVASYVGPTQQSLAWLALPRVAGSVLREFVTSRRSPSVEMRLSRRKTSRRSPTPLTPCGHRPHPRDRYVSTPHTRSASGR